MWFYVDSTGATHSNLANFMTIEILNTHRAMMAQQMMKSDDEFKHYFDLVTKYLYKADTKLWNETYKLCPFTKLDKAWMKKFVHTFHKINNLRAFL